MGKKLANYLLDEDLKANIDMVAELQFTSSTSFVASTMDAAIKKYMADNGIKPTTAAKRDKKKSK